jgi:hypothetical protein
MNWAFFKIRNHVYLKNNIKILLILKHCILFLADTTQDAYSTGKNDFDHQTTQLNNINSWHEQVTILRERENINVGFDLPRFLVLRNRRKFFPFFQ